MNAFEERGRAQKVSALLVTILSEGRTIDQLERWHADRWVRFARRAGVNPPSFRTMADVLDQLERRERGRAA